MKYIGEKSLAFMSGRPQKYPSVFFNSIEQFLNPHFFKVTIMVD
jgi:hypothetical protein